MYILYGIGIFLAKIAEITLQSVKLILLVRNRKFFSAAIAFFEVLIWAFIISGIISSLQNNYFWLIMYCLGYALGFFVGSIVTDKLSLGFVYVQFITSVENAEKIIEYLETHSYGFTKLTGEGSQSVSIVINTIVKKKLSFAIISDIKKLCNNEVFSTVYDVDKTIGGIGLSK